MNDTTILVFGGGVGVGVGVVICVVCARSRGYIYTSSLDSILFLRLPRYLVQHIQVLKYRLVCNTGLGFEFHL